MDFIKRLVSNKYTPIGLLLLVCLVIALFTYQDFGQAWDEPLFYEYADAVPYAYSIPAHLGGNFDDNAIYGPSAEDHKRYGPAYLLLARSIVLAWETVSGSSRAEAWHIVNFAVFLVGVLALFQLASRWLSRWAAFSTTLIFCTQPLLWGHAYINPKDMPYMTFFLLSILAGYWMVDRAAPPKQSSDTLPLPKWFPVFRIVSVVVFIILFSTTAYIFLQFQHIQHNIPAIVQSLFRAPEGSLVNQLVSIIASNPHQADVSAYFAKASLVLNSLRIALVALTVLAGVIAIPIFVNPRAFQRAWRSIQISMPLWPTILAATLLGLTSATRVLGPLAGVIISLHFMFKYGKRAISGILLYGLSAYAIMVIFWPYLWSGPVSRLFETLTYMSDYPLIKQVLYQGKVLASNELPLTYIFTMLGFTLTEPVWILFAIGLAILVYKLIKKKVDWKNTLPLVFWFFLPFSYILLRNPALYDGARHFMFILPPVFIIGGFALDVLFSRNTIWWLNAILLALLTLPGVSASIRLHPYEYAYYNSFSGGMTRVYRNYDTDYWLLCYKDAFDILQERDPGPKTVLVRRAPSLGMEYQTATTTIEKIKENAPLSGDYLLETTRINSDKLSALPELFTIGRQGATFCVMKEIK